MTTSNNQKIDQLLRSMKQSLTGVHDETSLYALLQPALNFHGPIRYNNRWPWSMTLGGLLLMLLLWLLDSGQLNALPPDMLNGLWWLVRPLYQLPFGPWSPFVLLTVIGIWLLLSRYQRLKGLVDAIWHKNLLLDNQLQELSCQPEAKAREFERRFFEFNRGNHKRSIDWLCQGHYQGEQHQFDYQLFDFHYVDKHTTTTTDSKGRSHTRTTYSHYHRYGVIMSFGFTRDLNILGYSNSGQRGIKWEPASLEFRKQFKVLAGSEMTAAKFFKPAVVEQLQQLGQKLRKLNLEFNSQAELCLTVADSDFANVPCPLGLEDAQAFLSLLQQQTRLVKLDAALHTIHQLLVYNDNNF
jgi:hypothetical protein